MDIWEERFMRLQTSWSEPQRIIKRETIVSISLSIATWLADYAFSSEFNNRYCLFITNFWVLARSYSESLILKFIKEYAAKNVIVLLVNMHSNYSIYKVLIWFAQW